MRHLMNPMDFSVEELDKLFDLAADIERDPEKYAHKLIKYVWDYAKKRVTKFAQKYNEMKSALASMTWCYKRELDKSQKLERDLESYDYRKKTPEELRDLAAAKERKIQQQQSRKPSKGFGNSYSD